MPKEKNTIRELVDHRFTPLNLAARGGSADVYRARDEHTGELVALKVLREGEGDWRDRFEREAQALEQLSHPAIVRFVASGRTDADLPYVVTQWVEGVTLRKKLRAGPMSVRDSLALVAWISAGLGQAHERGLIHRDVKPANIIVTGDDATAARLIDFGLIRKQAAPTRTLSGMMLGTAGYMSPEQIRNASTVDARSDVFSLGCVLFQCLTGVPPFESDDIIGMIGKVMFDDSPRVSDHVADIPRPVNALVARMMSKQAENRPADASEVATLAKAGCDSVSTTSSLGSSAGTGITGRERRILSVILAGERGEERAAESDEDGATVASALVPVGVLEEIVLPFGGVVELLGRGLALISLRGAGGAADHAVRAARCALELRHRMPLVPLVLVTGRADPGAPWAVGEMFDRGAKMVRGADTRQEGAVPGIRIDDVTAGLLGTRFEVAKEPSGPVVVREVREPSARRSLLGRPTPCVGREREMAFLGGLWAECLAEPRSRFVVLTGPPGVGKSRLRHEFIARTRSTAFHAQLWSAEADPHREGSPLSVLRSLIADAVGLRDGEPDAIRYRRICARVARHARGPDADRVAAFLAEAAAVHQPDDKLVELRAARANPALMGDQIERAWLAFLSAESRARPLLLVIDDLHWADAPSDRLLARAARDNADRPILILAFARPEILERLEPSASDDTILFDTITKLSAGASKKLVRTVMPSLDPALTDRVAKIADGNPFFLEELIRAVAGGKEPSDVASVVAIMQARLEELPATSRRVLRAASTFGEGIRRDGLLHVLGDAESPLALDAIVETLVSGEWLTVVDSDAPETTWTFRHAIVRDAAYAMLTAEDRRLGHRLAAEWLEARGEQDGWVLANHFVLADRVNRAAVWFARAAEQAMEANDHARAITCTKRGLELTGSGEVRGQLLVLRAEAFRWHGEHQGAADAAEQAVFELQPDHPRWPRALEESARAHARLGVPDVARQRAEELIAHARHAPLQGSLAVALCRTALGVIALGEVSVAQEMIDLARAASDSFEERDPVLDAQLEHARAVVTLHGELHFDQYATALSKTVAALGVVGDVRATSAQKVNLGYVLMSMGALEEGIASLEEAIELGEPMGLNHVVTAARHNLGYALALAGELARGLEAELRSVEDFAQHADRRLEGAAREYVARILYMMGRLPEAEAEVRRSLELTAPFPATHAASAATMAYILAARGRHQEAIDWIQAQDHHPTSQGIENDGTETLALALALHGVGRVDEARRALTSQCAFMAMRAATIADTDRRASFLSRSPMASDTAALAARLGVAFPR
jgi:eukaryotic-like serine/threonine-protein kinase